MKKIEQPEYIIELANDFDLLAKGLHKEDEFNKYALVEYDKKPDRWMDFAINISQIAKNTNTEEDFWVNTKVGLVIGQCQIKMHRSSNLNAATLNIYIEPMFRNKGVGYILLKDALSKCRDLDCQTVKAIINPKNIASVKLFKKLGFELLGLSPDRFRNGKLILFENYYKHFRDVLYEKN